MLTKEYEIKFSEINYNNELKETVFLNFLQDAAATNAEDNGFGYSFISKNNWAWFLLKYHLKIYNWPKNPQNLTIKTWPKGISKIYCLRDFEVLDEKGNKIAVASSSWALLDIGTKKLISPKDAFEKIPIEDLTALDTKFPKIEPLTQADTTKIFDIEYNDIDINQHVNNANYVDWALETLDFEFRTQNTIREIQIQYKKEIKYGNKVVSEVQFIDNNTTTLHSIKNKTNGEELCLIKIIWSN